MRTPTQPGVLDQRLRVIDPLSHSEWDSLVAANPKSSFFHTSDWARVLQETYGHRPVYCCRYANGQITDLLPVMEVTSPLLGRRGVSLPFTDFCNPLVSSDFGAGSLYGAAMEYGRQRGWRTFELRHNESIRPASAKSVSYWGHTLNLSCGPDVLFRKLKSSLRCGVRKAERAGLRVEFGVDAKSMRMFFKLHCLTRQRHGMPCQSLKFFENIVRFMLAKGHGFIATAWHGQSPVAAAMFFHQGEEAFYKFGASDYAYQRLRPNNLLMWQSIRKCCVDGFSKLHFGRTSLHQQGLRRFKLGFGAQEEKLEYFKYDYRKEAYVSGIDRSESPIRHVLRFLPLPLLRIGGRLVYPDLA